MKNIDTPELWDMGDEEGDEEVDEPPDSVEDAEGALPLDVLAPGGSAAAPLRRRFPGLVSELQRPDRPCTSIEDIYRRYQQLVWDKLQRPDIGPDSAAVIHQEVFLMMDKLVQKRLPASVPATLLTIAWHLICNYLRQRERRPRFDDDVEGDALPASQLDVEQKVSGAERKRIVESILAQLPTDAAMLMRWIDLDELTQAEVAEMLGRPLETVRTQHRRALEKFRALAKRLYAVDLGGSL